MDRLEDKHTTAAQFIVFFILSNGITVLQVALMPAFKAVFAHTSLVDTAFQFLPVVITIAAAALQVLYKDPIYAWAISAMGAGGETVADVITMIINAAISF